MIERPLGKITAALSGMGLEVTYAYDDLVFVQHSAFLLQFTDDPAELKLFLNSECEPEEASSIAANMVLEFHKAGFDVKPARRYTLSENENQTMNIKFN